MIQLAEYWGKDHPQNREHTEPILIAIFIGISIRVDYRGLNFLHQVLIYMIAVLLQLHQFWNTIWGKLVYEGPYDASIWAIKMRLPKLQDDDKNARKLRSEKLTESWKDIKEVLYYQRLLYIPKVIYSELISWYYDNPLVNHFEIDQMWKLIARKYY